MKKICMLAVLGISLSLFARSAEISGWQNRNPDRKELIPPGKILWQENFAGTMDDFSVEYRDGAKGSVKIENGKLKIVKSNAAGFIVIKSRKPFEAPLKSELQTSIYVSCSDASPDFTVASIRLVGKDGSLAYFGGLDGRGGGGPKMNYLTNTPPGVRERKLAHLKVSKKTGTLITPAIVVGGGTSSSVWSGWQVEDYHSVRANWRKSFAAPKAVAPFFKLSAEELKQHLAASPDHTAQVVKIDGFSRLLVDGKVTAPVIFKHVKSDFTGVDMEKKAGIGLRSIVVQIGENYRKPGMWKSKDVFDPAAGVKKVEDTLRSFPDAKIILSIRVEAYAGFGKDFPSEVWKTRDGKVVHGHYVHSPYHLKDPIPEGHWAWPSYSSKLWRSGIKKYMAEFIRELKKQNLSKNIVGVHICGYHDGQMATRHADFSEPAQKGFREYLQKKYHTPQKLSAAWGRKIDSFDKVVPPEYGNGLFYTAKEQDKLDYYTFIKHEPFRAIEEFAEVAKREFGKDIIALRWSQAAHGGTFVSAYDVEPFLESKYVDALIGQPSYARRTPGLATKYRLPLASFHTAGKLFIHEFDLRTWPRISPGETELRVIGLSNAVDKEMWQALHRKMSGQMIADNMGYWYLDMGGGWFEHPDIVGDAVGTTGVMKKFINMKPQPFTPSAVLVIDNENCMRRNFVGKYYSTQVDWELGNQVQILSSSGVAYDIRYLKDLLQDPALAEKYSTLVFTQMYQIDAPRRKLLEDLGKKGKTVVMLSCGGVLGGLKKYAGFTVEKEKAEDYAIESVSGEKLRHISGLHMSALAVSASARTPGHLLPARYHVVPAAGVAVKAVFSRDKAPAIVEKRIGKGKLVYISVPGGLSAEYFNQLVRTSGGYVTVDRSGLQVDMNGNFMSVHCVVPGKYKLRLKYTANVNNLKDHSPVPVKNREFELNAEAGATYWFEIRKSEMEKRTPRPRNEIEINYDESKVPEYTLPSPLICNNGKKVTTAQEWLKLRRPEILDFYTREYYGKIPPMPDVFKFETVSVKDDALDGTAIRKEIKLSFAMKNGRSHSFVMLLYIPKNKPPMPVFCGLNFLGNHATTAEPDVMMTGRQIDGSIKDPTLRGDRIRRWQFREAVKRGYAVATACYHDIFPDYRNAPGSWENSIYAMFFPEKSIHEIHEEYTAIGAWAWALQRMLDVLESEKLVDASRAAVIGHSRLGKTALWAGANDERFKMVITNGSGHGGAALIRRFYGETNEVLCSSFPHWFVDNFRKYIGTDVKLKHDQHFLLSLMAPRALCIGSATLDRWADPKGEFLSGFHASEVYKLFGAKGMPVNEQPVPDTPVFGEISYQVRTGKHDLILGDWLLYWGAADRLWK